MEMVSFFIHAYLYLVIYELLTGESRRYVKCVFVLLFGIAKYIAELGRYTEHLVPLLLCTLLILYSVCIYSKHPNVKNLQYALVTYGIDFVLSAVLGCICGIILGLVGIRGKIWPYILTSIGRIVMAVILHSRVKYFAKIKQSWVLNIGLVATVVLIFAEQIIRVAHVIDNMGFMNLAISCIYLAILFTTLWLIDHHRMVKIQKEYADDNKQMSQKLHRSKEIIPLLANYASSIDEEQDPEMRRKLRDICQDYGRELGSQELSAGLFSTTGIEFLDMLLQSKIIDYAEQNIELNVFVNTQIDKEMKRLGIGDAELTRMIGDLLQNAVHAIGEAEESARMILVIIARDADGCLEIHVCDSGVPFPQKILDRFGQRGNTTWGTGNGIADLMETLDRANASLRIIQAADPDDVFTKEICIRFDGKAEVELGASGGVR